MQPTAAPAPPCFHASLRPAPALTRVRAWIQSEKSKALTRTCVATKFECGSMRANPVSSSTVVALDGNDGYVVFVVLVLGGDQPRQALLHTPAAA